MRTIKVTHLPSGREKEFNNRTEFYGRNQQGGWLAKANEGRDTPFPVEDFLIEDVQTPEHISHSVHTAKMMLKASLEAAGVEEYVGYIGKGASFREERSTLIKYKGQRGDLLTPINMARLEEIMLYEFGGKLITGIEADDQCVIDCYQNPDVVLIGVDKDYYGTDVRFMNYNRTDEGIVDCSGFGKLWRDDKGKVRGFGRIFFYWQVAFGDNVDNYRANSACSTKWGEVSAFNALKDATNDKEAMEALVKVYQKLYPEPKMFTGWRGDEFEIDWRYVMNENWDLARMLRWEGDVLTADMMLDEVKVIV